MTNLYFRYSEIYERTLYSIAKEAVSDDQVRDGYEFVDRYVKHWEQYNETVFKYFEKLGFATPDFWIAYFVNPTDGMTPFSDPLTLFIKKDLDEVTATLIHELTHVMLSFGPNMPIWQKLWNHMQKTYPGNDWGTNVETITILIARGVLREVLGVEKAETLLAIEKNYPSLKKAWQIIDSQLDVLAGYNPIEAILKLNNG